MLKKMILAALTLCAANAFAADKQTNIYVGVDAGSSKIDGFSGRMGSVGGFAGYQMTNGLSLEAGYRRMATLDFFDADVNLRQSSFSLIGTTEIGHGFDFFGRVGYNKLTADATYAGRHGSASDSGSLFGLGIVYNVNTAFSIRLEGQRPGKDASNFSAAMLWKF